MFGPVAVVVAVTGVAGPSALKRARATPVAKKTSTNAVAAVEATCGTNGIGRPKRRTTMTTTSQATISSAACHQCREKVAQKQITPTAIAVASDACERASHAAS